MLRRARVYGVHSVFDALAALTQLRENLERQVMGGCGHVLMGGCGHVLMGGCGHVLMGGCGHVLMGGCGHVLMGGCGHVLMGGCGHVLMGGCGHVLMGGCGHVLMGGCGHVLMGGCGHVLMGGCGRPGALGPKLVRPIMGVVTSRHSTWGGYGRGAPPEANAFWCWKNSEIHTKMTSYNSSLWR